MPLEQYVEQALMLRTTTSKYTPQQIRYWLTRLAQELDQRHLSEFSLACLHLSWLQPQRVRTIYSVILRLLFGLAGGTLFWLAISLFLGPGGGMNAGLSGAVVVSLLLWRDQEVRPRERISWSWREAGRKLVSGLASGIILGIIFGLISSLVGGLLSGMVLGLIGGLGFGLILGLVYGLLFGAADAIEHYFVRCILWQNKTIPWHYARFLEEATNCLLLQRANGGYRFTDPLLQEYFASRLDD
jgi:MFS family permease